MKEILTCLVWNGLKIKTVIDRETGEFVLYNSRFKLDIQDNKAYLSDINGETPIFTGYLRGETWFFEEQDYFSENEDPYVAAIQMLYDIIQYC
jgi:hypothetical protein